MLSAPIEKSIQSTYIIQCTICNLRNTKSWVSIQRRTSRCDSLKRGIDTLIRVFGPLEKKMAVHIDIATGI